MTESDADSLDSWGVRFLSALFPSLWRAAPCGDLTTYCVPGKEDVMRRTRTTIQALIGATVIAGGMAALTPAAQAATIDVACSEDALVAAVTQANNTPDPDTLTLAPGCTYSITASHGSAANGQEALPVITTDIEMTSPATSPATITRATTAPPFRIAEVSPTGKLTLTRVALTNGNAASLGYGGAILNFGAVTLTDSSLSGNTATAGGGGLANADTSSGTAPTATFTRSPVSNNTAVVGGGIFNGRRATLTTTGVSLTGNRASFTGGGIAAIDSTSSAKTTTTTLTDTTVTTNSAGLFPGGVYRQGGTMTTTNSPITGNTPNNCVGSNPAVPNCTG